MVYRWEAAVLSDSHVLYPHFANRQLRDLRGQRWAALFDWISTRRRCDPHAMALTLMLRRLGSCADPGCALCALRSLEQHSESEQELLDLYYRCLDEVTCAVADLQAGRAAAGLRSGVA